MLVVSVRIYVRMDTYWVGTKRLNAGFQQQYTDHIWDSEMLKFSHQPENNLV